MSTAEERIRHGWTWLRGPIAGLFASGSLAAWLSSLPWAAILAAMGSIIPVAIGTFWGWVERRDRFEFERQMRRVELQAARKRLRALHGDQIRPDEFAPHDHPEEPPK